MQLLFSKRQYNSVWGSAEFAHPPWVLFGGRRICTVLYRIVVFFQDMCYWTEKRRVKLSGSSSSFRFYRRKMRKNSDIKQSIWFKTANRPLAGFPWLISLNTTTTAGSTSSCRSNLCCCYWRHHLGGEQMSLQGQEYLRVLTLWGQLTGPHKEVCLFSGGRGVVCFLFSFSFQLLRLKS